MVKSRYSGPTYANGNHKSQQKAYNKSSKGKSLRDNANKLNRKLGTYGIGDGKDAAHYKGSTTKGWRHLHSTGQISGSIISGSELYLDGSNLTGIQ